MAATNALVFPGGSGDYAAISAMTNNWRTNNGVEWLCIWFAYLDSLAPGEDGWMVSSRRTSNNDTSSAASFDDGANRWEVSYNTAPLGAITTSPVAATWYGLAMRNTGASLNNTLASFSTAGSLIDSVTSSATSSVYSDSQAQSVVLGARYNGTSTSFEMRGRIYCPVFLWRPTGGDPALPDNTAIAAFIADPLNVLAQWRATYGANMVAFEGSLTDAGPNAEVITLNGAVTLGTGNGPTVPDLTVTGSAPDVQSVDFYDVVYVGQQGVRVNVEGHGTEVPLVSISTSQVSSVGTLLAVRSHDADDIVLESLDALPITGPCYLWVINQDLGDNFGQQSYVAIESRADPGPLVIALRATFANLTWEEDVAFSEDHSPLPYLRTAQETLTYGATGLPTGLSINTSTGVISGTIDGAASGTYVVTVTCTDENGDVAQQVFSLTVTEAAVEPTVKSVGNWGRRTRVA